MPFLRLYLILAFIWTFAHSTNAQKKTVSDSSIAATVLMDEVVVTPGDAKWTALDFIDIMKKDTSLYEAFTQLRRINYQGNYEAKFYNKTGWAEASAIILSEQNCRNNCCTHKIIKDWNFGPIKDKNGNFEYLTMQLLHQLFLRETTYCKKLGVRESKESSSPIEYMKQIIFQPGQAIDFPLIGHKTAIFSARHYEKYEYHLQWSEQKDKNHKFTATLRPEYRKDLPIQSLETWFAPADLSIQRRKFFILEKNWLLNARVTLDIQLQSLANGEKVPGQMSYNGAWKIPGQAEEKGDFFIQITPK